ncbi:MAG: DUF3617 family protein, partial [Terriglobales bacterium]
MMNKMLILVAGALLLPLAYAIDYPEVREGLWSIRTQTSNNLSPKMDDGTSTVCRDHAYDKSVQALAKATMKDCTTVSESVQGGKYTSEVRCVIAGTTVDTKGTTTYQGDTSHSETHATYTPAMQGLKEMTMIMDSK